jgi:hypothetical protein
MKVICFLSDNICFSEYLAAPEQKTTCHVVKACNFFIYFIFNNNNLLTAIGLSPGGSGYFTFKLRQTY